MLAAMHVYVHVMRVHVNNGVRSECVRKQSALLKSSGAHRSTERVCAVFSISLHFSESTV